jgi:phosphate:Na+ symporter
VVIGANIGTTVTALLAAIGATPNARRAAAAHVLFNLLTATVALLLLPWIIGFLGQAREAFALPPDPASKLALFHTAFNVLGVLLVWPLAAPLTEWLQRRFRASEEDEAQPRFLDDNVLAVPTLALDALEREVSRMGQVAARMARAVLAGASEESVAGDRLVVSGLDSAIERFVEQLRRAAMSKESSARLAELLRVQRYYVTAAELAQLAVGLQLPGTVIVAVETARVAFLEASIALLDGCDPKLLALPETNLEVGLRQLSSSYEALKGALLTAGALSQLNLSDMERALRSFSALRRAVEQMVKALLRLKLLVSG